MSTKTLLIIIVILVIIIIVVFFVGKQKGKKWSPDEVKLPSDVQEINAQLKDFNPGPITDGIDKVTSCYFFCGSSATEYQALLELSNSQFVAVYNDWNKRIFPDRKETMLMALENTSNILAADRAFKESIINKLKALGLK